VPGILEQTQRVYAALDERLKARVEAGDLPKIDRSYPTVGNIDLSLRCSQFVVAARRVYNGQPGVESPVGFTPHFGAQQQVLEIGLGWSRCWKVDETGVLPVAKEAEMAAGIMAGGDVLRDETLAAYYGGELVDSCNSASVGPLVFIGPEGGIGGVTVMLAFQI
jgi:hypothetical protein